MAPLIREVNRKHKGNRTKIAEETKALYKEHGVNPAAAACRWWLQLPLLFALYQALIRASNVVTLSVKDAASDTFTHCRRPSRTSAPTQGRAGQSPGSVRRPGRLQPAPVRGRQLHAFPAPQLPADRPAQADRQDQHHV